MTDKEHFDSLMRLSEFWTARWNGRRQFEWAISLGLWAVLGASIAYVKSRPPECVLVGVLVAVSLGYIIFWVKPLQARHERDTRHAFYFKELAEASMQLGNPPKEAPPKDVAYYDKWSLVVAWAPLFQIVATMLLAICVYFMLGQAGCTISN